MTDSSDVGIVVYGYYSLTLISVVNYGLLWLLVNYKSNRRNYYILWCRHDKTEI